MAVSLIETFRKGDYRALLHSTAHSGGNFEKYLPVRSAIVLGEYDLAETKLRSTGWQVPFYENFLKCQLAIYRRMELNQQADALLALQANLPGPEHPIFGEYNFVFGHLYHLIDKPRAALRHVRRALDCYLQAGCVVQAAHALYNLSVSHKHLNLRDDFERTRRQLSELAQTEPGAEIPWLRLEINLALDFEEFEKGLFLLQRLEQLVRASERMRDLGTVTCQQIYALICLNRYEQALGLCDRPV